MRGGRLGFLFESFSFLGLRCFRCFTVVPFFGFGGGESGVKERWWVVSVSVRFRFLLDRGSLVATIQPLKNTKESRTAMVQPLKVGFFSINILEVCVVLAKCRHFVRRISPYRGVLQWGQERRVRVRNS